jgi:hypothetical protein
MSSISDFRFAILDFGFAIDAIQRINPNITPDRSSLVATLPHRCCDRPTPSPNRDGVNRQGLKQI